MIKELNDNNYEEFITEVSKPLFIDFYSPSCLPCQVLLKQLDFLDNYGESKIIICKINADENPKLSSKYMLKSVPFCCTIDEHKNIKEVCIGLNNGEKYLDMINGVLNRSDNSSFIKKLFS